MLNCFCSFKVWHPCCVESVWHRDSQIQNIFFTSQLLVFSYLTTTCTVMCKIYVVYLTVSILYDLNKMGMPYLKKKNCGTYCYNVMLLPVKNIFCHIITD